MVPERLGSGLRLGATLYTRLRSAFGTVIRLLCIRIINAASYQMLE